MSETIIKLVKLTKKYNDVFALHDLDMEFKRGGWVSIVGPSGSGKSTMLNIVGAMDRQTSGEVIVDGQEISELDSGGATAYRRTKVGFVFQQHHLIPYLTAIDNVMLAQYFHSIPDPDQARRALSSVGIEKLADRTPNQLSGGEKQRVCIARSLINEPPVLLLDEPTGNLDSENTLKVLQVISELQKRDKFTILCATHNPVVAEWGDRVIELCDGRLISDRSGKMERSISC